MDMICEIDHTRTKSSSLLIQSHLPGQLEKDVVPSKLSLWNGKNLKAFGKMCKVIGLQDSQFTFLNVPASSTVG
jgi:hypothetical protein